MKRCNLEETDDGVRLCRGNHDKWAPCDWEYFVRNQHIAELTEQRDELLAALVALRADMREVDFLLMPSSTQKQVNQAIAKAEKK